MRSVVIARYVPWPPNSGDKQRTLAVVRALQDRGPVILCAFEGPDEDSEALREQGVDVRSVPQQRGLRQFMAGLARGRSLTAARFWDRRLSSEVDQAAESSDVIVYEHVQSTMYARRSGPHGRGRVVDMHNIESALAGRVSRAHRGPLSLLWRVESLLLQRVERRVSADDVVAVVSGADRATFSRISSHPGVVVAPNGWNEVNVLEPALGPVVSFVALLSWGPNVGAALWLANEVWPRVLGSVPEAQLMLVGRNPTEAVRGLANENVAVTGTVPDLEPYYLKSAVCLAPLLAGGGSRLKILEALAAGRPVVSTRIGVEGLEDLVGRGVILADDAESIAAEIVGLLRDPARAVALGRAGAHAVSTDHAWASTLEPMMGAITSAVGR